MMKGSYMQIYLVGGAVRDELLGLPVKERDWVVVGATPAEMKQLGYRPVGKDFPVFLHPKTHEEYALARTERKISKGYKGFEFYADPSVTLEDDLKRRDLTINAIAETPDGKLIDPYHGREHLKQKLLRHVSEAFAEDPVRILRVARFAARFCDFKVHPDTVELMWLMVSKGEVDALVPERVWQELQKTLGLQCPQRFFEVLRSCDALAILFPEIELQYNKCLDLLQKAAKLNVDAVISFAVLMSPLDEFAVKNLCDRVKVPREYKDLALLAAKYQNDFANLNATASALVTFLEQLDAFRRPDRFNDFLLVMEICGDAYNAKLAQQLREAYQITAQVNTEGFKDKKLSGPEIKQHLHELRISILETAISPCRGE